MSSAVKIAETKAYASRYGTSHIAQFLLKLIVFQAHFVQNPIGELRTAAGSSYVKKREVPCYANGKVGPLRTQTWR